jgi:cytochrome P450
VLALFRRPGARAWCAAARFGGEEGAASSGNGNGSAGGTNGSGNGNGRAAEHEGAELTDAEVVDACLNFIIAGRDTTAQAISWAFYELARHPDAEARLLAEAAAVLGSPPPPPQEAAPGAAGGGPHDPHDPQDPHQQQHPDPGQQGGHPTYDQLRQLRYARAVFLESVRLHPSVPQDCKFALSDDVLPDGAFVPRGALVLYSPYVVCRLPSFWGPDAGEFRPERWLKEGGGGGSSNESGGGGGGAASGGGGVGTAGFLAPSPYVFPAFNAGPRLCLGRGFAELEGVYALVETLRRYRFGLVAAGDAGVTYEQSTSLPMLGGLRVRVMPRWLID